MSRRERNLLRVIPMLWGIPALLAVFLAGAAEPKGGLRVTYDIGARRYVARVTRPEEIDYALRFAAGKAKPRHPRIVRVEDCRGQGAGAGCVPVKGIYLGRSPY